VSNTSLHSQNDNIPDPPIIRLLGVIFTLVCCAALLGFILFVLVEFTIDITGNPVAVSPDVQSLEPPEEQKKNELPTAEAIKSQFHFVSPIAGSAVPPVFPIIYTWKGNTVMPVRMMDLWIDGVLTPWEMQFGNNTWMRNVILTPGKHRVKTPIEEIEFEVIGAEKTAKNALKIHEGIGESQHCNRCHQLLDNPEDLVRPGYGLTIGAWKGNASCLDCHGKPEMKLSENHLQYNIMANHCNQCHAVHGGDRRQTADGRRQEK
jgi:hypothetical protein